MLTSWSGTGNCLSCCCAERYEASQIVLGVMLIIRGYCGLIGRDLLVWGWSGWRGELSLAVT